MRKLLIIFLLIISCPLFGQRISSAISFTVPIAGMIHYDQNYYSPQNYYRVYMVNAPNEEKERYNRFSFLGFGKMYRNIGLGIGYTLKIDYKRIAIRLGYRFNFKHSNVILNQLTESSYSDEVLDNYPVHFIMESFHHQYPIMISYDLKKQNNSPFINVGVEPGFMFAKIETTDWNNYVFFDRYKIAHLYGFYYNNSPYIYAVAGIGLKRDKFELALNYKFRLDKAKDQLSMHEYLIDVNLNIFLSNKTIRKKHYLFYDE
jgi:hypothetical protein